MDGLTNWRAEGLKVSKSVDVLEADKLEVEKDKEALI